MDHDTVITIPAGPEGHALRHRAIAQLNDPHSALSQRLACVGAQQLPLPGIPDIVEGFKMRDMRDYLARILALEEAMDLYRAQQAELYEEAKGKNLPVKTMRSALKIAKAERKRDTSLDTLDACIKVVKSLLPPDEEEEEERTQGRPVPDMTRAGA